MILLNYNSLKLLVPYIVSSWHTVENTDDPGDLLYDTTSQFKRGFILTLRLSLTRSKLKINQQTIEIPEIWDILIWISTHMWNPRHSGTKNVCLDPVDKRDHKMERVFFENFLRTTLFRRTTVKLIYLRR